MATAGSKQGGGCCKPPAAAADQEFDPRYEWQENATGFILRIHLSGFRKQDFRVQVDGAGRLTVRGQRSDAAANPRHSRFSKAFQLPSTSNLNAIAGRFEAGVLTITVPKRLPASHSQQQVQDQAKAPAAGDDKPTPPQDQRKAKEDEEAKKPKDDAVAKPKAKDEDATTKKPAAEQQVADAKSGKPEPEQQHKAAAPPPPAVRKEEGKPKPGAAAPPAPAPAPATDTKEQAATPKPAPPPPQADAERKAVDPESLAERVNRRAEEERAKAAAEAAAAEEAERQRKACRGFKERVTEELQGLAGSEWAEGLVETAKKNKEVIVAAVAAFSLGVFVSSKLLCRCSRN